MPEDKNGNGDLQTELLSRLNDLLKRLDEKEEPPSSRSAGFWAGRKRSFLSAFFTSVIGGMLLARLLFEWQRRDGRQREREAASVPDSRRNKSRHALERLLAILAGLVLIGAAVFAHFHMPSWSARFWTVAVLSAYGCFCLASACRGKWRAFNNAAAKFSLIILTLAAVLALGELTFRALHYDFSRWNKPDQKIPIYYRLATVHAGEGVMRRPGPMSWTGQVLRAYMRMHGTNDAPYADEPSIVVNYDAQGFRNPTNLVDWDVVVAGDSFVELGYLPYDDLFTTIAGKQLGVRVKNLGVSGTGPISQTLYIKQYGKAASTKDAVICFFEGNDGLDMHREIAEAVRFRSEGIPAEFRPKNSLLQAATAPWFSVAAAPPPRFSVVPNAFLTSAVPARAMTVYGRAVGWDKLTVWDMDAIVYTLKSFRDTARQRGMRPWLMYIPDSHRVFHGMIHYSNTNSQVARFQFADFAGGLGQLCAELDIKFINTYPALRHEAETGRVPYNLIGDTHFNLEGSRIVANVLADSLKAQGR